MESRGLRRKVRADVVVVGAGISGLTAALSAREAGAEVALLEKGDSIHFRGLHNAALSSRLQRRQGLSVDAESVISTIMQFGDYRADQRIVNLWAANCSRVMDWLLDLADTENVEVVVDPTTKPWYFPNYPTIHVFLPKWQETLAFMLFKKGKEMGVRYFFQTRAMRLLRKDRRVKGVLAEREGEAVQFEAKNGVILCTGDYGANRQMVESFCGSAISRLERAYEPALNTGDGHLMAMELGAAIDDPPHAVMLFDFPHFKKKGLFNLARQPWMYVNLRGERFMNEDLPWGYECNQILRQPGQTCFSLWDSKWDEEWPRMRSQCCKNMGPPTYLWNPKDLEEAIEKGHVIVAPTLKELAKRLAIPADRFLSQVERYNVFARMGKDLDFGKHPERLTTLERPPFFACRIEVRLMVTLGGLKIDERLQVLDTEGEAIPGLYAAGNVSGSFFGAVYPTTVPGLTHSRAWTFGWLAGRNAARAFP
jgi:fumarate reductase flavoprotein subunit